MIEVADFLKTGSFKIGAFKIHMDDLITYDDACDVFGTPVKIYSIIGHEGVTVNVFEELAEGKLLVFAKDSRVLELHLELYRDLLIKDMVSATGVDPTMVVNKKIKYLFFSPHFAGRIFDEHRRTLDILGFFNGKYLKEKKLPFFFLSGIVYDQLKLRLIYEE